MRHAKKSAIKTLIVDDQPIEIALLNFLVTTLGHEVRIAFDGEQAWQLATQEKFDLIILDWHMPNLPGWAFLKRLELNAVEVSQPQVLSENIIIYSGEQLRLAEFTEQTPFRILDVWQKPLSSVELLKNLKSIREKIGA